MDLKFDFNDITILPAITSKISSRSEINARYKDGCLPLCTAPMDMVINNLNKKIFHANNIRVVLPRGETSDDGREIISVSLSEIIELYDNGLIEDGKGYLIDIANGHMEKLVYTIKILKKDFPNIFLIVGNIAHPETYRVLSEAGADGIRVGIGGGGNCFIKGTKVITNNGEKNIEDVVEGDLVLTKDNTYCEVYNTLKYLECDDLININDEITCTKSHEFLVVNKEDIDLLTDENIMNYAFYIEAEKLTNNYFLVTV